MSTKRRASLRKRTHQRGSTDIITVQPTRKCTLLQDDTQPHSRMLMNAATHDQSPVSRESYQRRCFSIRLLYIVFFLLQFMDVLHHPKERIHDRFEKETS